MFVKQYAKKSTKAIVELKGKSQGNKVIIDLGVNWEGIISGVCMLDI